MKLVGSAEQQVYHYGYRADGSITSATAPQLVLPNALARSQLFFQNKSASATMHLEFGAARATCAISGGSVTSGGFTITNPGFNFTRPPLISFLGGGQPNGNTSYVGAAGPQFAAPSRPARARCVLTSGVVTSIVLDDPGAGYVIAPMVFIYNDPLDPNGCADPSNGGGDGLSLGPGQSVYEAGSGVTTDPVAVFCGTAGEKFFCRYMT